MERERERGRERGRERERKREREREREKERVDKGLDERKWGGKGRGGEKERERERERVDKELDERKWEGEGEGERKREGEGREERAEHERTSCYVHISVLRTVDTCTLGFTVWDSPYLCRDCPELFSVNNSSHRSSEYSKLSDS